MSLDAAEIDLSRSFTPGMGYVALSRVRSMDGVYLSGVNHMALQLHPLIFEFDTELRDASESLGAITPDYNPSTEPEVTLGDDILPPYDPELFLRLKQWRATRAREDKVSAFIVAHNTLLEELARRKPQTFQQLLGVKGFGQQKLDKYGGEILDILQA
jgi:superfamily II DNA helicase RecQ